MAAAETRDQDARVAMLRTSIMGSAMARNLLAAGLSTTVWDLLLRTGGLRRILSVGESAGRSRRAQAW
jgi:3-hydroxyisobutyrate dehydrogenase-like beta-hydroxyacid dehydrogenase